MRATKWEKEREEAERISVPEDDEHTQKKLQHNRNKHNLGEV